MRQVEVADWAAWRDAARAALVEGYQPEEIAFVELGELGVIAFPEDVGAAREKQIPFGNDKQEKQRQQRLRPHVPKEFVSGGEMVAAHRDPARWDLLYRLLWRLQSERMLLKVSIDSDVRQFELMRAQVARDVHKMHAFVRFRKVEEPGGGERYVAFYEPQHRVLRLAAPFFRERFGVMRWAILTPDESVRWEPDVCALEWSAGVGKEAAPQEDALEEMWRSYYGAIFNPARVNPRAMKQEMPVRYWKHLPEVALLPELMQRAETRVATMVKVQSAKTTAAPWVPEEHSLKILRDALPACEGCELYKHATQAVPGAGAGHARLMLVGEQPGDQEDRAGEPFVGPAGGVLRQALAEIGIDAKEVFMTNAVKHFKYVPRGKFRLHQSPAQSEVTACRPWLEAELDAVKPRVVLCLGATAAKSLLGGTFRLMEQHGEFVESKYAERVMATVHPSAVLRAQDEAGREKLYGMMVGDLKKAWAAATK